MINWAAIILRVQGNKYGVLIDFNTSSKGHQQMALMQALIVTEPDTPTEKAIKNRINKKTK